MGNDTVVVLAVGSAHGVFDSDSGAVDRGLYQHQSPVQVSGGKDVARGYGAERIVHLDIAAIGHLHAQGV